MLFTKYEFLLFYLKVLTIGLVQWVSPGEQQQHLIFHVLSNSVFVNPDSIWGGGRGGKIGHTRSFFLNWLCSQNNNTALIKQISLSILP